MGRVCRSCNTYKDDRCYTPFKNGKNGLYPTCKECRKPRSAGQYRKERPEYRLYYRAKRRAKIKNLDFSITEADIKIPAVCPVFNIPMDTPSLDRIDSSRGYTPDNIQVISNRANMLKNNATVEELEAIIKFIGRPLADG